MHALSKTHRRRMIGGTELKSVCNFFANNVVLWFFTKIYFSFNNIFNDFLKYVSMIWYAFPKSRSIARVYFPIC